MAMSKTNSRRRLSPAERRKRLLEVGLELFGEAAYDELSTDEIAERGDISRGLLFHYFGSKRGYYVAVIRAAADRLLENSRAASDQAKAEDGGHPGSAQLEVFLDFVEDNAGLFTLLMHSGVGVDRQVKEIVDETRHVLARRVAPELMAALEAEGAMAEEGHASGSSGLGRLALTAWIGAVEAVAVEWADLRRRGAATVDRRQLIDLLTQMLPPAMGASRDLTS